MESDIWERTGNNRQIVCFHKREQPEVSCLGFLLTAWLPATAANTFQKITGNSRRSEQRKLLQLNRLKMHRMSRAACCVAQRWTAGSWLAGDIK